MKIAIIGSSIAGASSACNLAKHAEVNVFDSKSRKEIGKKVCANVFTSSFLKYAKQLNLTPKNYIVSKFDKIAFLAKNTKLMLNTSEFKINREKLIEDVIKQAEKNSAKFHFNTHFTGFKKKGNKFIIKLSRNKKIFFDSCDILIGADGANSKVAKCAGLWNNRKFFLFMQTEIPAYKLSIPANTHLIYLGKKFGYYSYIFSAKNKLIIGIGDNVDRARKTYSSFLKFLNVKSGKVQAALIPKPKLIPLKKNLFLIGDAGCYVKFSGGGVVPAMISANAVKEIILNKKYNLIKKLRYGIFFNKIITKILKKFTDKDWNIFLKIISKRKFASFIGKRDEFETKDYLKLLDFRFLRFIPKLI